MSPQGRHQRRGGGGESRSRSGRSNAELAEGRIGTEGEKERTATLRLYEQIRAATRDSGGRFVGRERGGKGKKKINPPPAKRGGLPDEALARCYTSAAIPRPLERKGEGGGRSFARVHGQKEKKKKPGTNRGRWPPPGRRPSGSLARPKPFTAHLTSPFWGWAGKEKKKPSGARPAALPVKRGGEKGEGPPRAGILSLPTSNLW